MSGIQVKLLAFFAGLMTALPPSACCLLASQPCCRPATAATAGHCCSKTAVADQSPACCSQHSAANAAGSPLANPPSAPPCQGKVCCCGKVPATVPGSTVNWQFDAAPLLFVLPANWGTWNYSSGAPSPVWRLYPSAIARHALLCVWRC